MVRLYQRNQESIRKSIVHFLQHSKTLVLFSFSAPPSRTDEIWGSFEDSETKNLDVGTSYWYSCRQGLFQVKLGPMGTCNP